MTSTFYTPPFRRRMKSLLDMAGALTSFDDYDVVEFFSDSIHATPQYIDPLVDSEMAKIAGSDKKPSLNAHYQVLQHRGRWAEVKKKIETS